jgi:perosamine synthetase
MTSLIPISQRSISELEISYVTNAVQSGWVSLLGPYIEEFERSFAEYCGTKTHLPLATARPAFTWLCLLLASDLATK